MPSIKASRQSLKSSNAAAKAIEKLNKSLNSQGLSQAASAKSYADSMERAARSSASIATTAAQSSGMMQAMIGVAASGAIARQIREGDFLKASRGSAGLLGRGGYTFDGSATRISGYLPPGTVGALPAPSSGGALVATGGGGIRGFIGGAVTAWKSRKNGGVGGGEMLISRLAVEVVVQEEAEEGMVAVVTVMAWKTLPSLTAVSTSCKAQSKLGRSIRHCSRDSLPMAWVMLQ